MGRLTGNLVELPASEMDIKGSAEMMQRTLEAMSGASQLPVMAIKVPCGGGRYFSMGDDLPPVASIEGVILSARYCNVYWDKPIDEGNGTPACSSGDGMSGWYMLDGELMERSCRTCKYNKMKSGKDGKGKACKNIVRLKMLIDGQALPVDVKVPTMSVDNFSRYLSRELAPRRLNVNQVTTKLSLREAVNGSGNKYSQIVFECTGRVDDKEIAGLMGVIGPMLLEEGANTNEQGA